MCIRQHMDKQNRAKLTALMDETWEIMKDYMTEMREFLLTFKPTPNINYLLYNSLRLVAHELSVNRDLYKKYPLQEFNDEDFVNLVITSMTDNVPGIAEQEENAKYMENIRKIVWGYIKKYKEQMSSLLSATDVSQTLNDNEMLMMQECMMVVLVECILRKREMILLENNFSQ